MNVNSMLVYLEDAPANSGVAGVRGLSKAVVPLLRCIDPQVQSYFVNQTHARIPNESMPEFVRDKFIESKTQGRFVRNSWKLAPLLPIELSLAFLSHFGPKPLNVRLLKSYDCVFVPIGVDPGTLMRGWAIAEREQLPLQLYFVDDIETHPSNADLPNIGDLISMITRKATKVYTITDELGELFTTRYGIKTRRMPLIPNLNQEAASNTNLDTVFAVYLGSINHLYEDGLRQFVSAIDELRKSTGEDLKLRFFSTAQDVRKVCKGKIPDWVTAGPEDDDAVIRKQIELAQLCFLPYSFEGEAKTMVSTSFPSKLLDYLVGAKAIVVYAPDYSISFKLFSENRIPYVVSTWPELGRLLKFLFDNRVGHEAAYKSLLESQFGPGNVKEAFEEN